MTGGRFTLSGKTPARPAQSRRRATGKTERGGIAALRAQLRDVVNVFRTPMGRNVAVMIAAADQDTELAKAFRNHSILARRNEGRALLEQAIAARDVRADIDIETLLDLLYAPLFFRLLLGHAPLDADFTDSMVSHALAGFTTARARRASS